MNNKAATPDHEAATPRTDGLPAGMELGTVYLFLRAMREERIDRAINAKDMRDKQMAHDVQLAALNHSRHLELNNFWAVTVKNVLAAQNVSMEAIIDAVADLKKTTIEQYVKLGITQDLLKEAKEQLKESR